MFEPPEETELYFCGGAVTVRLRNFVHADPTLRILWKRQVAESTLTLCLQGRLLLHYEHGATKTVLPLPFAFEQCRVSPAGECLLLEADTMFAILDRSGAIAVLSDGKVTERGRTVTAEVPLHDSLARRMRCRYENGRLSECTPLSARPPQEATVAIALLESVLAGFDPTPYLAPALAPKAGLLREYLGRFTAAVYRGREQVGLVYPAARASRRPRLPRDARKRKSRQPRPALTRPQTPLARRPTLPQARRTHGRQYLPDPHARDEPTLPQARRTADKSCAARIGEPFSFSNKKRSAALAADLCCSCINIW